MANHRSRVPSYRKKKVGNKKYGIVSLPDGVGGKRDVSLGRYGTPESRAMYDRVIAEWQAAKMQPKTVAGDGITVNELILRFMPHAELHYRRADGTQTNELNDLKLSMRPLKQLYGFTLAKDFGPLALEAVREVMIRQPITCKIRVVDPATGKKKWAEKVLRVGLARGVINQRISRIRRLFRWAASKQIVPVSVHQALTTLDGLQAGRTQARESEPVRPVSLALVESTLPHMNPVVADMLRLQVLCGARSGEICIMRGCDIDTTGSVWLYRPHHHKMIHQKFERVIPLGPQSQAIVKRYLKPCTTDYLFSPRHAMAAFRQRQRQGRKSPIPPSQLDRRKKRPKKQPGDRYTPRAIAHAVWSACEKAKVEHWHPHMLRHTAATLARKEYGLDAARALLGQHSIQVAEEYAALDQAKAIRVAKRLG